MIESLTKVLEIGAVSEAKISDIALFDSRIDLNKDNFTEINEQFNPDIRFEASKTQTENSKEKIYNPDKRIEIDSKETKDYYSTIEERILKANESRGEWLGIVGNSEFRPDKPEAKQALEKYSQSVIEYKDGNPDFSKVSEGIVNIDNMTSNRDYNYAQADKKCAELWNEQTRDNQNDWTARDVKNWRKEKKYTWHECLNRETMNLVPFVINHECKHIGGVSECKKAERANGIGEGFDE